MRAPQDTSFEDRLSHWIAAQGFWFQLRHSTGKTVATKLASRLLSVALRLLVVAGVCLIGLGIYLVKRVDSKAFRDRLHESAAAALGAESATVTGFQRGGGKASIHRFEAEGGNGAFFTRIDARGVRYGMGLLDGLAGKWDAGPVRVTRAGIAVKAGAEDEEEAAVISRGLFGQHDWFRFPLVDVLDATVVWGYSKANQGQIKGSHLIIQRMDDGWRLQFRGGQFTQNWLSELEIDELVAVVTAGKLVIESARMHRDNGVLLMSGQVKGGVRPAVQLEATFQNLPLRPMLPPEARVFLDGTISGTARIGGSTNSQDGVTFDCKVVLGDSDQVVLLDRLLLLQALAVVDPYPRFRKVPFSGSGSEKPDFRIRTGGGEFSITDLQLEASDLMMLSGGMKVRPPTPEEVSRALAAAPRGDDSSFLRNLTDLPDAMDGSGEEPEEEEEDDEFSLRRAAEVSKTDENEAGSGPTLPFPSLSIMPMSIQEQARNRHARMLRFEGGFLMRIPGDVFEDSQKLRDAYPADPASGWIPLEVPLSGTLFDLTVDQAKDILLKGRKY